jgi:hypothetical protein
MTAAIIDGADVTGANFSSLPEGTGITAGYVTGSGGVPWSAEQFAAHPDAIRIDQSPANTVMDETADVLDVEAGAATLADIAPWVLAARSAWAAASRPGQRHPAVYASRSSLTAVCNALAAARVTGVGLWVADWTGDRAAAAAMLEASSGPYPVIGVQYADRGLYDADVFLESWVNARSAKAAPRPPAPVKAAVPPGQWDDPHAWTWAEVSISGTGEDGKMHTFAYSREANVWAKVLLQPHPDAVQAAEKPHGITLVHLQGDRLPVPGMAPDGHLQLAAPLGRVVRDAPGGRAVDGRPCRIPARREGIFQRVLIGAWPFMPGGLG